MPTRIEPTGIDQPGLPFKAALEWFAANDARVIFSEGWYVFQVEFITQQYPHTDGFLEAYGQFRQHVETLL